MLLRRLSFLIRCCLLAAVFVLVSLTAAVFYDATNPPVSTLMLGRWLSGKAVERTWVPLSSISPNLIAAVVTSEDGQFCEHQGVDWDSLNSVLNDPDGPSRGASTIPMQTVKNLFLWPGRSFIRKGLEIPLALALDAVWSKRKILEAYLNIAEWGDGLYGAEAAARTYFKKPASQLTSREAALLATALPNPAVRNPMKPSRVHRSLAATIIARAAQAEPWVACLQRR